MKNKSAHFTCLEGLTSEALVELMDTIKGVLAERGWFIELETMTDTLDAEEADEADMELIEYLDNKLEA